MQKEQQTPKKPLLETDVSGTGNRSKKLLNVKETSKKEVQQKWDIPLPELWPNTLYIRCNSKGIVNWEIAPVYKAEELIKRGNYNVIK